VLICGESGTGKELVARALHDGGRRKGGPFVAVNCAAIPQTLIEGELFGHVRGAFTDATSDGEGLFVQAHGGTLFLDEVGELPLATQATLLRVLQERKVRPVGGRTEIDVDVRIVAASNRDLDEAVAQGRFRDDLLYRLDVVRVPLPPLRERGHDVLLLAQHFAEAAAAKLRRGESVMPTLDPAAAECLLHHDWPGNVRELENCMEHAVALGQGSRITSRDLSRRVRGIEACEALGAIHDIATGRPPRRMVTLEELERGYILHVLRILGGNKTQSAEVLGIDRRTLYRRVERHGMEL
jgi:DNA-binding NtrC family response regulator